MQLQGPDGGGGGGGGAVSCTRHRRPFFRRECTRQEIGNRGRARAVWSCPDGSAPLPPFMSKDANVWYRPGTSLSLSPSHDNDFTRMHKHSLHLGIGRPTLACWGCGCSGGGLGLASAAIPEEATLPPVSPKASRAIFNVSASLGKTRLGPAATPHRREVPCGKPATPPGWPTPPITTQAPAMPSTTSSPKPSGITAHQPQGRHARTHAHTRGTGRGFKVSKGG
jgi:hypothetical protein